MHFSGIGFRQSGIAARTARSATRLAAIVALVALYATAPARADFVQQGPKVTVTDATGTTTFGSSVAVSADGNTMVVSSPGDASPVGGARVFVRTNGAWTQQGGKLVGTGAVANVNQGAAVAISADGNTILVGGACDSNCLGAVWVFVRTNGTWSQQGNKLVGTGAINAANQGRSLALSADGNTALIGAPGDFSTAGAAWVFTRTNGVWAQQGNKLFGTGGIGNAYQGSSVALSADGDTAIVGGPSDQVLLQGTYYSYGAAWVFKRTAGVWTQVGNKLVGTGASDQAGQGSSVSLSSDGKTAAIGSKEPNFLVSVWIFTFDGSTWTQQSKLSVAGNGATYFPRGGISLAGDGNTLLAGGQIDNSNVGAAWVFNRSNSNTFWYSTKLVGASAVGQSYQGAAVALSTDGSTAIVGGPGDNFDAGAVWTWVRRPPHDSDGDARSDILWRNVSGETGMWLMNGTSVASTPSLGVIATIWSVVGQRDFNGDGKSDLLWRNTSGDTGFWFMNGGTTTSIAGIGNIPSNWSVVGTGDFNGDGKPDLLWRSTSGEVGIWFMDAGTVLFTTSLGNPGTNWSVAGMADFNGDGRADILWRSTSNDVGLWLMDGATVTSTPILGNVGSAWSIVGTGDFDGGGKADILWRSSSNDVGIWFMNGSTVTPVGLGNVGAAWNVASVGDYNGDGKADILWRSTSHDIGIWFMKGATLLSTVGLGNVGPNWQVQNAASN